MYFINVIATMVINMAYWKQWTWLLIVIQGKSNSNSPFKILSLIKCIVSNLYKIPVIILFTSKPNTSCTDAPLVRVLWYAWLMKYRSNTPNNAIRATEENQNQILVSLKAFNTIPLETHLLEIYLLNALMWNNTDITGLLSI